MKRIITDSDISSMMECMKSNLDHQNDPMVGSFWYDGNRKELFGVYACDPDDVQPYTSEWGEETKTGKKLHEAIWKKESHRNKDLRFRGDYTLVPRGRVFQIRGQFVVMTGHWIDNYPEARNIIREEFDLPEDTKFEYSSHWELGHGWSQDT